MKRILLFLLLLEFLQVFLGPVQIPGVERRIPFSERTERRASLKLRRRFGGGLSVFKITHLCIIIVPFLNRRFVMVVNIRIQIPVTRKLVSHQIQLIKLELSQLLSCILHAVLIPKSMISNMKIYIYIQGFPQRNGYQFRIDWGWHYQDTVFGLVINGRGECDYQ